MNGKVERLRRELAEAEMDAGVPVSGEPFQTVELYDRIREMQEAAYTYGDNCKEAVRIALDGVLDTIDELYARPSSRTNAPHALAAAQAEVKRLREALRNLLSLVEENSTRGYDDEDVCLEVREARAALYTHADTSELDRLAADAGRAKWQPIETAPMDELILVGPTKRMGICVAMNNSRDGWVTETCSEWYPIYTPTHWVPLPDAPDTEIARLEAEK